MLKRLTQHYMDKGLDLVAAHKRAKQRVIFEKEVSNIKTNTKPKKAYV